MSLSIRGSRGLIGCFCYEKNQWKDSAINSSDKDLSITTDNALKEIECSL
ncbi:hypothetical protein [Lachnoclostridium phytofermentans]|nr:hypothetical protein [Lachnoclostridium phytofermentans]